ncbi:hypothetical protein KPH14_007865 [Odynerus spinipes]|uniref:Uncharacterized protein n=1 Tax=Odynerus spinipes TaxID=1348599 RepID=A0AAD9S1E0_9HYME|nr:hypothetical protein KPH14_007865 [Odynerus spinipes]
MLLKHIVGLLIERGCIKATPESAISIEGIVHCSPIIIVTAVGRKEMYRLSCVDQGQREPRFFRNTKGL